MLKKIANQLLICILLLILLIGVVLVNVVQPKSPTKDYLEVALSPESSIMLAAMPVLPEPPCNKQDPLETKVLSEEIEPRYGFTDEDIRLLAQLLCGGKDYDGDGEYDIDFEKDINYYEVSKVLCVVMNRVRSTQYPDKVLNVVLQEGQFSPMPANLSKEPSDIAVATVKEWCEAYDRGENFIQVIPEDHLYFRGNSVTNITRARFND